MKVLLIIHLIISFIWFLLSDTFTVKVKKKKSEKTNLVTHIALFLLSPFFPILLIKIAINRIVDRIIKDMEDEND